MKPPPWQGALLLSVGLGIGAAPETTPRSAAPLRGLDGLARAYDFILDARFDQVDAELRRACGPAPAGSLRGAQCHRALVADPA